MREGTTIVNPFESEGIWFKANLHAHTTNSDGILSVDEQVRRYRKQRYHILAITDHDTTSDAGRLSSGDFLVINGTEISAPAVPDGEPYHLVCLNVPAGFNAHGETNANPMIDLVRKVGGEVIMAHPYWSGHNINHLWHVRGYVAMEVYNGTCSHTGRGVSSVHWDELLGSDRRVNAVACDDSHGEADSFMGWTMIRAKELSIKSVMDALRAGSFYASCGPTIEDFRVVHGVARVRCSPVVEIHFICNPTRGYAVRAGAGRTIAGAEFRLDHSASYVRAEVVGRAGRCAWTNPIVL